jgi:hypothetical protein
MTVLSCMFDRAPTTMGDTSPRSTHPNHTLAPSSIVTSPISAAVGAM